MGLPHPLRPEVGQPLTCFDINEPTPRLSRGGQAPRADRVGEKTRIRAAPSGLPSRNRRPEIAPMRRNLAELVKSLRLFRELRPVGAESKSAGRYRRG